MHGAQGSAPKQNRALRVCIDARLPDGGAGGLQQTIVGLAAGLAQLTDGDEEYLFLVDGSSTAWLRPHLGGNERLLASSRPAREALRGAVRRILPAPIVRAGMNGLARFTRLEAPRSDGTVERAGVDVVHLALQQGFVTSIPTIYVPHDLQHRHHPELFSRFELRWREALYPTLSRRAERVVALSRWGRRDLVEQLGIAADKIHVIGWAPVLDTYPVPAGDEVRSVQARLHLPDPFAYYPAQTYRHKNHLRLLEALARIRDAHGIEIPLVCSGRRNDFYPTIERAVRRLGLAESVRFVGFVSPLEIQVLYRLCRLLVFPSLFEGFGMPVHEAFRAGVPVACSNATSLPEIAGDAALLFDPGSAASIAHAVHRLWTDSTLRDDLSARGRARVATASWSGVARSYRALYRLVGRRPLTEEDTALVSASSARDA